jgi:hypothetical protein
MINPEAQCPINRKAPKRKWGGERELSQKRFKETSNKKGHEFLY